MPTETMTMKPIKIIDANREAIDTALKAVNGKAVAFTVTHEMIPALAIDAERSLEKRGITKQHRTGTQLIYRPAGPTANAYKYAAQSTLVQLRRDSNGIWSLVSAQRVEVHPKQAAIDSLVISQAAKEDVERHAMHGMTVAT